MKVMMTIMKTMTRTCFEKSLRVIMSLTLRTGMKSLIQVLLMAMNSPVFLAVNFSKQFLVVFSSCQEVNSFLVVFPSCDFTLTAKNLVARLMEVDQDQRLTAQEAINHEW